ncbi:UbiH/UbiF family hydroxylase [Sulfurirhabdus autotrophica]|uniref:2-octaprenyl-3-methyl-6-methoxy-1,4-benzoquinol hydroxylase n=1 Tax=Sulfurirhabdus autotrophica TaxID=1706046 RepID=A0A4R3XZB6_9PROT|nr:UbiH/UbiF family hydroxylase [Sulfurirhabdus autotrophica]TCV84690.1 2-octaprenyl-3-methyl-6-methoxy-1,4-benzoquinol hydroxylase [Sulfurirhabdus autotrophica]
MNVDGEMEFDIIIVGAGLVGAAFARSLKGSGLKLALIENQVSQQPPKEGSWDSRIYAISPGNVKFLSRLAIWQTLDANRVAPVYDMHIRGDAASAQLDFSAYEAGMPELAFILESRLLQHALWQALAEQENLRIFCPANCESLEINEDFATLQLQDGTSLKANLIVAADGANSWVRSQAGIEANPKPYQQMGVVANFATEKHHGNIARQWFRHDGVLAWLPLPENQISIVWSTWDESAQALMALPEGEFCNAVREAGNSALGNMQLVTPPAAFPLRLLRLDSLVKPRIALIGDAAHNVHPLAGQGVNLGFHDAQKLAEVLIDRGPQHDCGNYQLLRRYDRARKEDILAMQLVTDGLQKLFNNESDLLRQVRNVGLKLTNKQGWIKNQLMRHALS